MSKLPDKISTSHLRLLRDITYFVSKNTASLKKPAPEFRTGDGCGDGDIQALGSLAARMEVGNEQAMGYAFAYCWRDAVAFVAHHDDALLGERLLVDVLTVK